MFSQKRSSRAAVFCIPGMLRRGGGEGGPLGVNGDRREGKQGFQRSVWGVAYVHFGNLSTYLGTQPYLLNKPSHLFLGGGGEGKKKDKNLSAYLPNHPRWEKQ